MKQSIYNFFVKSFFSGIAVKNRLRFALNAKELSAYEIPIVINNRNRFTFLKMQVDALVKRGYTNLYILDNNSTYPPLLEYYKTVPAKVIFLGKNLGYDALEKIPLYDEVRKSYFVYTDSDVVPVEDCPDNFMEYFLSLLKKYPHIQKVGFSLKIDDLPDYFDKKKQVIDWEQNFFTKKIGNDFEAPIDTTFALHRPFAMLSTKGPYKNIRTRYPYEARHMPWYNDSANLQEEEKYYINSVEIGTHWSNQKDLVKDSLFERLKKYLR